MVYTPTALLVGTLVTLGCILPSLYSIYRRDRLSTLGKVAVGLVERSQKGGRVNQPAVVSFGAKNGETVFFEEYWDLQKLEKGDQVRVRYSRADPSDAIVEGARVHTPYLALGLGSFVPLFYLYLGTRAVRWSRRRSRRLLLLTFVPPWRDPFRQFEGRSSGDDLRKSGLLTRW